MNKVIGNFLVVLAILASGSLTAQERQRQTIRTSAAEINVCALANDDLQFLYPEKTKGTVYYSDGSIPEYEMNYNFLLDEMHYLTRRGRVHALQVRPRFDKIVINDKIFVYDVEEGYLEKLHTGNTSLYMKREVNVSTLPVKRGAYGTTDHTSSIAQTTIHQPGAEFHVREVRLANPRGQELDITLRYNEYFIFEKNGEKTRINNRRQASRKYSDHRSEIRTFTRQNNIDFDDKEDMLKLAEYIESLYQ